MNFHLYLPLQIFPATSPFLPSFLPSPLKRTIQSKISTMINKLYFQALLSTVSDSVIPQKYINKIHFYSYFSVRHHWKYTSIFKGGSAKAFTAVIVAQLHCLLSDTHWSLPLTFFQDHISQAFSAYNILIRCTKSTLLN